jgi:hypothetical protein
MDEDRGAMEKKQIQDLVSRLDTANEREQEQAWEQLRPLGKEVLPFFLEIFPGMKKWQGRGALLYHATKFARDSEVSLALALMALNDRSRIVRYRALGLLAYSLKSDVIPYIEPLLNHQDRNTAEDARAAIDSIMHNTHHYFIDRAHSGQIFWEIDS